MTSWSLQDKEHTMGESHDAMLVAYGIPDSRWTEAKRAARPGCASR